MPSATNLQTIQPSDYESDAQGYTSDYPVVRPPVSRTKEEMNLAVLQKHNPEIAEILSVAPYVTIYDWAHTPGEWQKTGPNGTLFICQLTPGYYGEERYHAIVLNRSGLDNFSAELRQSDIGNVEISGDFVIITYETFELGGAPKANAVHIFSEEGTSTAASRAANGELMVALAEAAQRSRMAAIGPTCRPDGLKEDWEQFVSSRGAMSSQSQPQETLPTHLPVSELHMPPQPSPLPLQPSPEPQVAGPQPNRPMDLLALFQGSSQPKPEVEPTPVHPAPVDANNLLRLLQGGGSARL
ncbi:hypothetical protein PMZ80_006083 [Knufia obscura]|uniref:Uncharacterized protein n=2 Tax=Knufia TaxID=430999 RepID=A0AAN8I4Z4_9EURO|nr:hypothetical protein PMZ80_006083 [Knufia obscura]KAK5954752.1 hypothetical protein OHC33_004477 [Knufia fluminis]